MSYPARGPFRGSTVRRIAAGHRHEVGSLTKPYSEVAK